MEGREVWILSESVHLYIHPSDPPFGNRFRPSGRWYSVPFSGKSIFPLREWKGGPIAISAPLYLRASFLLSATSHPSTNSDRLCFTPTRNGYVVTPHPPFPRLARAPLPVPAPASAIDQGYRPNQWLRCSACRSNHWSNPYCYHRRDSYSTAIASGFDYYSVEQYDALERRFRFQKGE